MPERDVCDRARQALDGITDGPWEIESHKDMMSGETDYWLVEIAQWRSYRNNVNVGADLPLAEFIAAARTLVPELVAEVERDRARLAEWRAQYEAIDAENEHLRDLTQAQNGYNAQMTDERDRWKSLWRQNTETAATALRERDEALAEVERLRANQRGETVEDWHGKCKGGQ